MRVAVDLLGGDRCEVVAEGILRAIAVDDALTVVAVGPPERARALLGPLVEVVAADEALPADEPAVRAVRARRGASIRVATGLARTGAVDAVVTAGPIAATIAAAEFSLGLVPGLTDAALAAILTTPTRPVALLDCRPDPPQGEMRMSQLAVIGSALMQSVADVQQPVVKAFGPETPAQVLDGTAGDVVVTATGTAAVLLATLAAAARLAPSLAVTTGAQVVLGVPGVITTVGDGDGADAVASALGLAARSVRAGLAQAIASSMAVEVRRRRAEAGLPAAAPG